LTYGRSVVDLMQLHQKIHPRSLKAVSKGYLEKEMPEQPTSQDIINTSINLFNSIVETHKGEVLDNGSRIDADIASLSKVCTNRRTNLDLKGKVYLNEKGVAIINFGKYTGKPLVETLQGDQGYQNWVLHSADKLEEDVRQVIEKLLSEANTATATQTA